MSKNKKTKTKFYANNYRTTKVREARIREIITLLNGKRFLYAGEVESEEGELIGLTLALAERGAPEQTAKQWSIHCRIDGSFWIAER